MRIPYRTFPGPHGTTLFYPLIRIRLSSGTGSISRPFEALVDSGANECMFSASIAAAIGLNLKAGARSQRIGIGGKQDVWIHPVVLYVAEQVLNISAAFAEPMPIAGLLGRIGFFDQFKITFDPTIQPPGLELERVHKV